MRRGLFSEFYGIHQPIWNTAKTFLEGLSEIRIHITFPLFLQAELIQSTVEENTSRDCY